MYDNCYFFLKKIYCVLSVLKYINVISCCDIEIIFILLYVGIRINIFTTLWYITINADVVVIRK